ncbi:LacI family DNA-binding transcriptional regulator [Microbacterium sp.]|uniref:LacI family DNA-binding transcriptional regulator n=1 Tax=Microbacterium sp. TaxID=51671 RepID=UPI0039E67D91
MTDHSAVPAPRAGVREVAAHAGVSTQTVSRVLNGYDGVRPETRARVLDAVEALEYRMNNAARALGTRTTRTIGVIVSDAALYGPSAGIAALDAAARQAGRWIATVHADSADAASVLTAADRLLSLGVDGLIVVAPHAGALRALEAAHGDTPLAALHAAVGTHRDAARQAQGAARQAQGAALAVAHLVHLGHRRIGRVSGPSDWLEAAARDAGVDDALAEAGLETGPRWVGDWSADSGARSAASIAAAIGRGDGPTAIVVANDQMALGVIAGLEAEGIRVPGDVSVTGFDDNPDAASYRPALTSVRIDMAGEARRALAEVLGWDAPAAAPAPPTLVVRASTAPPAG